MKAAAADICRDGIIQEDPLETVALPEAASKTPSQGGRQRGGDPRSGTRKKRRDVEGAGEVEGRDAHRSSDVAQGQIYPFRQER